MKRAQLNMANTKHRLNDPRSVPWASHLDRINARAEPLPSLSRWIQSDGQNARARALSSDTNMISVSAMANVSRACRHSRTRPE